MTCAFSCVARGAGPAPAGPALMVAVCPDAAETAEVEDVEFTFVVVPVTLVVALIGSPRRFPML